MKRITDRMKEAGGRRFSLRHVIAGMSTPNTAQECTEREALLRSVREGVRAQVCRLPWLSLQAGERTALGGMNFQGAPIFVQTLCETILEHPERYPDLLERAGFLLARHKEAERWSGLQDELGSMYELASDQVLAARGESVAGATEILRRLEGAVAHEEWGGRAWVRLLGLMAARVVLEEHRKATGRGHKRALQKEENKKARLARMRRWEAQLVQTFQLLLARRTQR